jgi:hypothetical protein
LDISSCKLTRGACKAEYKGRIDDEDYYYETDALGITAVAGAIKDMGAMSSLDLLKNEIDVDQAKDLVSILKEHPTLKSLCGNKGDETELDMSGKMSGAGDAIMLAEEIVDNGALSKLDVRKNNINAKGKSALKKAAGVGVFRSRCVHLESLLFSSSLQHHLLLLPHCACRIKLLR